MTPENFVYWLQGWFELNQTLKQDVVITNKTLDMIEDHLKLVFVKETPDFTDSVNKEPTRYC
jgi:hypothetical protein